MRMAGPDIVLFVIGALLFGGAAAALVSEGGIGQTSALGAFTVDFPLSQTEAAREPVANFGGTRTLEFNVTTRSVTKMTVAVECTDPAAGVPGAQYNIRVEVTPPAGIEAPEPVFGICGQTIEVDVPVTDAPAPTTVQAQTEVEAAEQLSEIEGADAAVGTWRVTVSGARGGQALPVDTPGNPSGAVVLNAEVWTPEFTPVQR